MRPGFFFVLFRCWWMTGKRAAVHPVWRVRLCFSVAAVYPPRGDIPQPEPPEEVARILPKNKKELKKIKCYPISIDILPSPC